MRARVALVVAVLGLVLLALLVELQRMLHRPRRNEQVAAPAAVDDPASSAPVAAPAPAPPSPFRSLARAPQRSLRAGVAHLRGRVVRAQPADGAPPLEHLEVAADRGDRSFDARLARDGERFDLHVPPGRYTLTARAEGLIAVARDLILLAGSEREVVLRLEPAVAISGQVLGLDPSEERPRLFLLAYRAGSRLRQGEGTIEGASFTFEGLLAGETYDLEIGGRAFRTAVLHGITAPAEDLRVRLERSPVVRGAVGFARGTTCPFHTVTLAPVGGSPVPDPALRSGPEQGDDDDDDDAPAASGEPLEGDCRFELPVPGSATLVKVRASGPGWHAEEEVAIPSIGDPEPVCLNPPCRADPLEGLADLVVSMDAASGAEGAGLRASAGDSSCAEEGGVCTLHGLPVGEAISVLAGRARCARVERELVLTAGANVAHFACESEAPPPRAERQVLGVVRALAGGTLPAHVLFRCAGAGGASERRLQRTPIFVVPCPRDAAALEYQISSGGPWSSVAIPTAQDPAMIEIQVAPL